MRGKPQKSREETVRNYIRKCQDIIYNPESTDRQIQLAKNSIDSMKKKAASVGIDIGQL
jgi:hypothetical protein